MLLADYIKTVAQGLKLIEEEFVFVGGAVAECYVTSNVAEQARPTDDIDVVLELAHYGKYASLQENLIQAGFNPDASSRVICRYTYKGITVDIMPDEPAILGFSNKWYKAGIKESIYYEIDKACSIKIFPAPLYIASKIEAYYQRGAQDKRLSTDFEDIIYVLENRQEFYGELLSTGGDTKAFIKDFAVKLMIERDTQEAVSAVMGYSPLPERINFILDLLKRISTTI